jgi:hypothetical protein
MEAAREDQLFGRPINHVTLKWLIRISSMRINVKQHVLDYEGKPLLTNKTNSDGSPVLDENHRPVQEPETLRSYLVLALNNKARTETEPIGAEESAKRYQLSTKLFAKNEVELSSKEIVLLMDRIAAIYDSPLVVGRIGDMLEGREILLPADEPDEQDDAVVAKNLDLSNVDARAIRSHSDRMAHV